MTLKSKGHKRYKEGQCVIYLADLVHNYAAKGPHTFPLNIGYICAYTKKLYGDKVGIRLFKYPSDLIEAVKRQTPHVVGLGNYTWNLEINNKISRWIKSVSPGTLVVYGGPDYPADPEGAPEYLRRRPDTDIYVMLQGERGFANVIGRFLEYGSIEGVRSSAVENCAFYDRDADKVITADTYNYIDDMDEIPSPYLTGVMDDFFDTYLIPVIETNRGCPYSCTFCAWGNSSQRKIFRFPLERVKQEVEYIAENIKNASLLTVGDANFGILERDLEIAEHIKSVKCRYGYPRHMAIGWAKTIDRIIKMSDVVGDMVSVSCSLQTLDAEVMKNVKRTNISFDEFKRAQRYFNSKGVSTHTEIILALPGETRETHMKGLKDLFDYGTASMQCYNLRMLGGSRLNAAKNRKKYGLKTKYRLVDGCFGKYEDIISIESEEMVVGTDTMTMDDILYFRPIHFLIQFFWNYKYYKELLHFLGSKDINAVDFIVKVIANMGSASPAVKGIFDDFMKEARDEWFDTEEELFEHYSGPENFKMICEGGFGKLNFKYTYRFLLECKNECDEYVFATAAELLDERKKLDEISKQQMEDLLRYIKNRFIDLATVSGSPRYRTSLDFKYDIFGWKNRACIGPIPAAAGSGVKLSFILPNEQATALRKLYKQFKSDNINQTLRKMVECIMNKDELFYKVDYASNLEGK